MALTLRSARREFSEDHPWPTAEMKLLAELEQHSCGRLTNIAGEPPPAFATTDLNAGDSSERFEQRAPVTPQTGYPRPHPVSDHIRHGRRYHLGLAVPRQ